MKKIPSFEVNHIDLLPGVYVSRKDYVGAETLTTFDIRITRPNLEPVMGTGEIHTTEHLVATYLRNNEDKKESIVYFGPMGCRTGYYLIMKGDLKPEHIIGLLTEAFEFVRDYEGEVPGANARDCGNYIDMNLPMAKYYANKYLSETLYDITLEKMVYPK